MNLYFICNFDCLIGEDNLTVLFIQVIIKRRISGFEFLCNFCYTYQAEPPNHQRWTNYPRAIAKN